MDNGFLMLTRRKGQSVEIFTADEHIKFTVLSIFNKRVTCVTGDRRSFQLSPGGAPMALGLGMTLQLKECTFGQCKLAFHGPQVGDRPAFGAAPESADRFGVPRLRPSRRP